MKSAGCRLLGLRLLVVLLSIHWPRHAAAFSQSAIHVRHPLFLGEQRHDLALAAKRTAEADEEKAMLIRGEQLLDGADCGIDNRIDFNFTTNAPAAVRKKDKIPNAPHFTFQKFLTMQEKRVVVSFRFTDLPYLKPYFLTFASKLKKVHSDVIIEKRVLPVVDSNAQPIFEILVDGKIILGGTRDHQMNILGGRVDVQNTQSVFVSMEQVGVAIARARKKRRPSTLYGEEEEDDADDSPTKRWHQSYVRRNQKNDGD